MSELHQFRVRVELRDAVPVALQFLLGEQQVDLRVAGTADPDRRSHDRPLKVALVLLIVVASARDEVMPGERLLTTADRTDSFHSAK